MYKKVLSLLISLLVALAVFAVPAVAQNKAPDEIAGEVVYIPFPVQISIDGNFDDWAGIPVQKVTTGPKKSPNSKQNQVFDFSVASDGKNIYIRMHSVDAKVISGKHGKDLWNEDSLEFYVNFTENLKAESYGPGMMQINLSPIDIGKAIGDPVTVTGSNSQMAKITRICVKTADGWAFEASIPIEGVVGHGRTIGFQAQGNGATEKDRDSKLIWSKADKGDGSWQKPALFGKGVFFKVGSPDVPPAK
jgi:hypothetical protein